MKKFLLLFLMFVTTIAFCQQGVIEQPRFFDSKLILSTAGGFKTVTTADTTDAIDMSRYRGAITLFFLADTVGNTPVSDSCLTITPLLKNKQSGEWFRHGGVSVIDTLDRGLINVASTFGAEKGWPQGVYYKLPLSNAWSVADSAKFAIGIGFADVLELMIWIEGQ